MRNDDLILRVERLYAAIKASEEIEISKFLPKVINDGHMKGFSQDWSGGLTEAEITNIAQSLIYNIAHFDSTLKKWADQNNKDKTKIARTFNNSPALRIIKDLCNYDKHVYPPRDGGHSGKSPRIDKFSRVMQMTTKSMKNSFVALTFTPQGLPKVLGDGTAKVVVTGEILDEDGNNIGDFHKTALEAIKAWESVLRDFGVKPV
jgi:hypothetical protein